MKIPFKFIDDLVRMVRWFRKEEQYRAEAETRQQAQRALKPVTYRELAEMGILKIGSTQSGSQSHPDSSAPRSPTEPQY